MIISASRRTDIPAFYGEWLINRVREGYCLVPNPFNANSVSRVSLLLPDVDAFVFWSKNPHSFLEYLPELDHRGYNYYFLYTLNHYPETIEPNLPPLEQRLHTFSDLADRLGPLRVIWRYDPIILSQRIDMDFHVERFSRLSAQLEGLTHRVIISLLDFYRKTERRISRLESSTEDRFDRAPPQNADTTRLLSNLHAQASSRGMEMFSCAERLVSNKTGIQPGKCIDDALIETLFGSTPCTRKDPGQRETCGCALSRDIGMPNSCLNGCEYCYATVSHTVAQRNASRHKSTGEALYFRNS